MRGISIAEFDSKNLMPVELTEILATVGDAARQSRWSLSGIEALGGCAADELHQLSDEHQAVDGTRLAHLAAGVSQIIDGEFRAFRDAAESPWLVIYAVDSSAYDVLTDDDATLRRLRNRFQTASEITDS
jgi:hypothetical protein